MPTKSPLAQESKAINTKHAVWLRRRGAKTTENSLKLTGLDIYFRNATKPGSGIFKSGDIARGNLASYYVTSFQRTGLRNPRPLEFCGIFMNENSIIY